MSKKDYELIASAIWRTQAASQIGRKKPSPEAVVRLLVSDLGATLANDNPNFDVARFRSACGVNP